MSEPRGIQPEKDVEVLFEEATSAWKQSLPSEFYDWWGKERGEIATADDVLKYYDEVLKNIDEDAGTKKYWEKCVADKKDTNNFHLLFSVDGASKALAGNITPYNIKPFYINARFDNAWSKMCEQFPEDVKKAIEFDEIDFGRGGMSNEAKEVLSRLATYLNRTDGVAMTLLSQ